LAVVAAALLLPVLLSEAKSEPEEEKRLEYPLASQVGEFNIALTIASDA
jgi:hypothetical protein